MRNICNVLATYFFLIYIKNVQPQLVHPIRKVFFILVILWRIFEFLYISPFYFTSLLGELAMAKMLKLQYVYKFLNIFQIEATKIAFHNNNSPKAFRQLATVIFFSVRQIMRYRRSTSPNLKCLVTAPSPLFCSP